MKINFTKMHGIGNDYIYLNCMEGKPCDLGELSKVMSPRHFSVGSDGLVGIFPSEVADAKMRMFNLDGSEGKMCGNAIRCVGKYLYDYGICNKTKISIETLSGIKYLQLFVENGKIQRVRVDMGKANFDPYAIPVVSCESMIQEEYCLDDFCCKATAVSVGNPHCVIRLKCRPKDFCVDKYGPISECNSIFPDGVNTEFIFVENDNEIDMRVWERGSGETFACGTGACAAAAVAVKNGWCEAEKPIIVHLIGGILEIVVDKDFKLTMTGPCTKVYDGVYEYEN